MDQQQQARPPFVRFHREAIEDRTASLAEGHYVTKNIDFVTIVPPGGKGDVVKPAVEWLSEVGRVSKTDPGRFPPQWHEHFAAAYEMWKKGEEIPEIGTAIKAWPVLSPAQQDACIRANLRSVEDLASAPEEAIQALGMGGRTLVQRAKDWLAVRGDSAGKVSADLEAMRTQNADQAARIKAMEAQIAALVAQAKTSK